MARVVPGNSNMVTTKGKATCGGEWLSEASEAARPLFPPLS